MAKKYSNNQIVGILLLIAAVLLNVGTLGILGTIIVVGVAIWSLIRG